MCHPTHWHTHDLPPTAPYWCRFKVIIGGCQNSLGPFLSSPQWQHLKLAHLSNMTMMVIFFFWCLFSLLCGDITTGDDTAGDGKDLQGRNVRLTMWFTHQTCSFFSVNLLMSHIWLRLFHIQMWDNTMPPAHSDTCACTHTYEHITELMSDLPRVDSVIGCGLEHSNMTSGQVGQHKDLLVVICPSL